MKYRGWFALILFIAVTLTAARLTVQPSVEHWWDNGTAYVLIGPRGHHAGLTVWHSKIRLWVWIQEQKRTTSSGCDISGDHMRFIDIPSYRVPGHI